MSNIAATARHGFTEHEHLDNLALIHMNGRVQDPVIGRFLSADPISGLLCEPQSWNRYSYVSNRPLTLIDPSGFDGVELNCESGGCSDASMMGTMIVTPRPPLGLAAVIIRSGGPTASDGAGGGGGNGSSDDKKEYVENCIERESGNSPVMPLIPSPTIEVPPLLPGGPEGAFRAVSAS